MVGGNPPGTMTAFVDPIKLIEPGISKRAQAFYDLRDQRFPMWSELQDIYFDLDTKGRKKFLKQSPVLTDYWDWRSDFFHRNPDVVPFLSDSFEFKYASPEERQAAQENQPDLTWEEWQQILSPNMQILIRDYALRDQSLPDVARRQLEYEADRMDIDVYLLLEIIADSLR